MNFLLTRDLIYTTFWVVLIYALHIVVISNWVKVQVRSRIYFSPLYGFPGVNVIEDTTSPAYDPFESSLTTLKKVTSERKLEESSAWRNIIWLLRGKKSVRQLLERQKEAKLKLNKSSKVGGKGKDPRRKPDRILPTKK